MTAKRQYDYQERMLSFYLSVEEITLQFQFPHYPPMDFARADPLMFSKWVNHQALQKERSSSGSVDDREELQNCKVAYFVGERQMNTSRMDGAQLSSWAYVFYDPREDGDVAYDFYGRRCTAISRE